MVPQVAGPAKPLFGRMPWSVWKRRMAAQSAADCFPSAGSFSHRSTCRWYGPVCRLHAAAPTSLPGTYSTSRSTPAAGAAGSTASSAAVGSYTSGGSTWSGVSMRYTTCPGARGSPGTRASTGAGLSGAGAGTTGPGPGPGPGCGGTG